LTDQAAGLNMTLSPQRGLQFRLGVALYVKGDDRERSWSSRGDPRGARQQKPIEQHKGDGGSSGSVRAEDDGGGDRRVFEIKVEERG
jgi:hypothetical protein